MDCEVGRCEVCQRDDVPLRHKYYHYDINCSCHVGKHVELVRYCDRCTPTIPRGTYVVMRPVEEDL
jgi:hypothetical protein